MMAPCGPGTVRRGGLLPADPGPPGTGVVKLGCHRGLGQRVPAHRPKVSAAPTDRVLRCPRPAVLTGSIRTCAVGSVVVEGACVARIPPRMRRPAAGDSMITTGDGPPTPGTPMLRRPRPV